MKKMMDRYRQECALPSSDILAKAAEMAEAAKLAYRSGFSIHGKQRPVSSFGVVSKKKTQRERSKRHAAALLGEVEMVSGTDLAPAESVIDCSAIVPVQAAISDAMVRYSSGSLGK